MDSNFRLGNLIIHRITRDRGVITAFGEGFDGPFLEYMTSEGRTFRINPVMAKLVEDNPSGFEFDDSDDTEDDVSETPG